jgi:hypothetical protein
MHLVTCFLYFSDESSVVCSMPRNRLASNVGEGSVKRQDPTKSFATEDMPFDLMFSAFLLALRFGMNLTTFCES